MKLSRIIFGFGLVLFLFTNCEKADNEPKQDVENQKVLFQYEYINYAWGYQHAGWLIDSSGSVYCYRLPDQWNFCDSLGFIEQAEMEANLMCTDSICYSIKRSELDVMKTLIQEAKNGTLSEPYNEMCDAGISVYSAYIFDSQTNKYKSILLGQSGDFRIDNNSEAARELYNWLVSVNEERWKE